MDCFTSDINKEITIDDNINEVTVAEADANEFKNEAVPTVEDAKPTKEFKVSGTILLCVCVCVNFSSSYYRRLVASP